MSRFNLFLSLVVALLQFAGASFASPAGAGENAKGVYLPGVVVHNIGGVEWLSLPSSVDVSQPALNMTHLLKLAALGLPLPDLPAGIPAPRVQSNFRTQATKNGAIIRCETSNSSPYRMYSDPLLEALKGLKFQWCCINIKNNANSPCLTMMGAGYPKPGDAATDICNYTGNNQVCMNCLWAAWAVEQILDRCTIGKALNRQAGGHVQSVYFPLTPPRKQCWY